MKSNEFVQTVFASIKIFKTLPEVQNIVIQIDEIRKLHIRLQQKLDNLLLNPFGYEEKKERHLIRATALEIKEFCNQHKIISSFIKLPNDHSDFSNQFKIDRKYVSYWYGNVEITDLIVYHEEKAKKKQKQNRTSTIQEIVFEEVRENHKVFDENGNDLNELPGL